jgi:hypothetical protein
MSRPASLERLRDISKQRSIRRPLLVPVPSDREDQQVPESLAEWPIPK